MQIICPNCGASFDEEEPKCPYCDYINEPGAEKQYKEQLNGIRKDLDVVDELAEDTVRSSAKDFLRGMLRGLVICLVISLVITFFVFITNSIESRSELNDGAEALEKSGELHQKYAEWDALYGSGDYTALYERICEDSDDGYSASKWKHYYFYDALADYFMTEDAMEEYSLTEEPYYYNMAQVLYHGLSFCCDDFYESSCYSEEEASILTSMQPELKEEICRCLEIDSEEFDRAADAVMEDYGASYSLCSDYAKEYMGEDK